MASHRRSRAVVGRDELMKIRQESMSVALNAMHAERYDEMAEAMEVIAKLDELTVNERNMLFLAYTNMIASREASRRIISAIEQKDRKHGNEDQSNIGSTSRYHVPEKIESRICTLYERILKILDAYLIPNANNGESRVFCLKMKGDYHWRLAAIRTGREWERQTKFVIQAYKSAQGIAFTELAPSHPVRLELALKFSVFYHDVMGSLDTACNVAKEAIAAVSSEMDNKGDKEHLESEISMELLSKNFMRWMEVKHYQLARAHEDEHMPLSKIPSMEGSSQR